MSQAHNERDRPRQGHPRQRVVSIVVRSSQLTAVRSYEPNTGFLGNCGSFGSIPAHGWALAVQMLPMG